MLTSGEPRARRSPSPPRLRALTGAVLLVLGAGILVAVDQQRTSPLMPEPASAGSMGVAVAVRLATERELVVRLDVDVAVTRTETGQGDTNGSDEPEQLRLTDVVSRGFSVRLLGRSTPLVLGDVGRFGSGLPYAVPLGAEVVVVDCSVQVDAPRSITVSLRRGSGPVTLVVAGSDAAVVRALDDLGTPQLPAAPRLRRRDRVVALCRRS